MASDATSSALVAGLPVGRRRPALAPLRQAHAPGACRRGAGRARNGICARPAASRRTRRLDAYYVDALAVDAGWRRRRVARRLLEGARAEAAARRAAPARARHRAAQRAAPARSMRPTDSTSARSAALPTRARRRRWAVRASSATSRPVEHGRRASRRPRSTCALRSISGKNGSAIERAATSSQTGNSPSRWPSARDRRTSGGSPGGRAWTGSRAAGSARIVVVAVDPRAGGSDHEHEPAAHIAAGVLARAAPGPRSRPTPRDTRPRPAPDPRACRPGARSCTSPSAQARSVSR